MICLVSVTTLLGCESYGIRYGIGWTVAAVMEFFVLAFTDYCTAEACSADRAFCLIALALLAAPALIVIGAILANHSSSRWRLSWPFAAATLALSVTAEVLGFAGHIAAVGY
jgi:hypothetical protein